MGAGGVPNRTIIRIDGKRGIMKNQQEIQKI